MIYIRKTIFVLMVGCLNLFIIQGQSTIPVAGGNATGSEGSASYTVGQITYQTISGTSGSVAQGVQQPYEISVVTVIENTEGIILEYKVYPNPTSGQIVLTIKPFDGENFRYRIYDLNGILLQDKKIESDETEISIGNLSSSVYFLNVLINNMDVKTFRIIKN